MPREDSSRAIPRVVSHSGEAFFVIDDRQQIVQWSNTAAVTLGVAAAQARGQPCYQVVGGRDPFGAVVCKLDCPGFGALGRGRLTSQSPLMLTGQAGQGQHFLCQLAALPRPSGGALCTLVPHPRNSSSPGPLSFQTSAIDTARDLAALATLSTSLSMDRLDQGVEQALEWVRHATDAEAAELFLIEPGSGDMLLTAYRGPFRNAFEQITRFPPGEGFPGLVFASREPIVTRNLSGDSRYLRTRVKERGFESYVCVPLTLASGDVLGNLNVASRQAIFDVERALRVLSWASRPIGTSIEARVLQQRLSMRVGPLSALGDADQSFDDLLRAVLHQMMATGNATAGVLSLYDGDGRGLVRRATAGEFAGMKCLDSSLGGPQACPALARGRSIALYGPRRSWPPPCQGVSVRGGVIYCLPLIGDGPVGVIQVGDAERRPHPVTRYLPLLLNASQQVTPMIGWAWQNLQSYRRALAISTTQKREMGRESGWVERLAVRPAGQATHLEAAGEHPFLEVRCFGPFELYRQGRLVTPQMFQRRGALTLLKVLLLHGGRPVHRDLLTELLWPEADPQAAAARLYVLVHALRRVIEPPQEGRHWAFICSDGDSYYFNVAGSCWVDVQEFRRYFALAQRMERDGELGNGVGAYEAGVSLYRGDLLEEERYADWCWEPRESLREMYLQALTRLAAWYMGRNAPEKSVEMYRRALSADSLREEMHQGLMRALWLAGRRDEALRQYQVCKDALFRELMVAPLPETEQLYYAIRDGRSP